MHRSGTSALTSGLTVLGVSLGENLMPANEEINAKGFWEDMEIVAINDALLSRLGMDWRSLGYFSGQPDWAAVVRSDIAERAESYVKDQAGRYDVWGMKDPRMTRLLPFWQEIFRRCRLHPVYVLAIRHPLSVAASLTRRDGFPAAYGCYLWLEHVLPSIRDTVPGDRVVVSFDNLLENPRPELERIAGRLGLDMPSDGKLDTYANSFLDKKLRNFSGDEAGAGQDPDIPVQVFPVYEMLQELAADSRRDDQVAVMAATDDIVRQMNTLSFVLKMASDLQAGIEREKIRSRDLERELKRIKRSPFWFLLGGFREKRRAWRNA